MLEQVNRFNQEEFIWAMRNHNMLLEGETEDWKERNLSNATISLFTNSEGSILKSLDGDIDNHAKIISSLVPDEIIFHCDDNKIRNFEACVLYGNIKGVSTLVQKNLDLQSDGLTQLNQILGSYLGLIFQDILYFKGDLLLFTGECFLVIWKKEKTNQSMRDCCHRALDCALQIRQRNLNGALESEELLKATMAISAGKLYISPIGNEQSANFIILGDPFLELKTAQKYGNDNDIITCKSIWQYLDRTSYTYEEIHSYLKIFGVGQNWKSAQRTFIKEELEQATNTISNTYFDKAYSNNKIFQLRESLVEVMKEQIKTCLSKFIITPILRVIEMNEAIECLTEIRNVVVLFVDIKANISLKEDYIFLVNKCYNIIYKIVFPLEGSIINITLINGSIMSFIIFGLKGFRHDLESQRGLKCAIEIHNNLKKIKTCETVSISVTTGKVYCSAVGYLHRRVFSVLGPVIKKAAHLIRAYQDKVTLDRETFLQSKLEARHFVLQEVVSITRFKNVGPVYEFRKDTSIFPRNFSINKYPILDRDLEINLYLKLLKKINTIPTGGKINIQFCLIIFGHARQGKTRLIEEFVYRTPGHIPINSINLMRSDKNIPYHTIFLLFAVPLGISKSTPLREAKLSNYLTKQTNRTDSFFVLNEIFKVNFPKSENYLNMTKDQKLIVMKKLLKYLCFACFKILWLTFIDKGEYIDNDSWSLLHAIIETETNFLVITIDTNICPSISEKYKMDNMLEIILRPIDERFHVGLACQMLNVIGIPHELESVIHRKSNGNPGWIESYLTSLLHGNDLVIKNIPSYKIDVYNLVLPAEEMLTRTKQQTDSKEDQEFLENQSYKEPLLVLGEKWNIYKKTFSTSMAYTSQTSSDVLHSNTDINLLVNKQSYDSKATRSKESYEPINICILADNAEINRVESELSLNVIIMRTFDSLSSFEQLLVKCCSVIGESIQRDMLIYILNPRKELTTALGVKKLFETRLFMCAESNKVETEYKIKGQVSELQFTEHNDTIACKCRGLYIPDTCKDLPKYANCAFMKFKIPSFREIIYNLLNSTQKNDFHKKAVRYLEKNTRKCQQCGGGFFAKILGMRYDNFVKRKSNNIPREKNNSVVTIREDLDLLYRKRLSHTESPTKNRTSQNELMYEKGKSEYLNKSESLSLADTMELSNKTGLQKFSGYDLLRSFSNNDFSNCECPEILLNMYRQFIEHTEASDQFDKCINAMIEYSVVCIDTHNIPLAIKILSKTLKMVDEKQEYFIAPGETWKIQFIKGKTFTLLGKCRFELGQFQEALEIYENAIAIYGYKINNKNFIHAIIRKFQLKVLLNSFKRSKLGFKVGYEAEFCDDVSELFALVCSLFLQLGRYEEAEITAICSLKSSLKSEKDFARLMTALSYVIISMIRNHKYKSLPEFEVKGLIYLKRYRGQIEARDIKAVMNFYSSILEARVMRGELTRSAEVGLIILKMAKSLNYRYSVQDIYPIFIRVLVASNQLIHATEIVMEIELISIIESDQSGIIWFYTLCVCMHLDSGYSILPFHVCENYYYIGGKNLTSPKDLIALRTYLVVLWLWHLRTENFEDAEIWEEKLRQIKTNSKSWNVVTLFTNMYYLEGLLLLTVYNMNRKNMFITEDCLKEIQGIISNLSYYASFTKIIEPKLLLLKAFYFMIIQKEREAFIILRQSRMLAETIGAVYDENLIVHTELAWKNELPSIEKYFWTDHALEDIFDYNELKFNDGKPGYYTYIPPLYC